MDRRKQRRLPVRPLRSYEIYAPYPYRVVDISRSGCAVESNRPLGKLGTQIPFDLPLPACTDSSPLTARIVWTSLHVQGDGTGCHRYGLCFGEMGKVGRLILEAYLDYLRKDVHLARLDETWRKLKTAMDNLEVVAAVEERKKAPFLH
jgi:hypothetical protein